MDLKPHDWNFLINHKHTLCNIIYVSYNLRAPTLIVTNSRFRMTMLHVNERFHVMNHAKNVLQNVGGILQFERLAKKNLSSRLSLSSELSHFLLIIIKNPAFIIFCCETKKSNFWSLIFVFWTEFPGWPVYASAKVSQSFHFWIKCQVSRIRIRNQGWTKSMFWVDIYIIFHKRYW